MIFLNGGKLCAIDCETTGLNPYVHEITELAVIPLTFDLEPDPKLLPFDIKMQPTNYDVIDYSFVSKDYIADLEDNAFSPYIALELFIEWIERLELPINKRVHPLAHNWVFDSAFLMRWMGFESFNHYIDGRFHDLFAASQFINACDDFHNTRYHFAKTKLSYVCSQLGIDVDKTQTHTALYDAMITAQGYKKICQLTQCFV